MAVSRLTLQTPHILPGPNIADIDQWQGSVLACMMQPLRFTPLHFVVSNLILVRIANDTIFVASPGEEIEYCLDSASEAHLLQRYHLKSPNTGQTAKQSK